ncbi:MAG: hypothetical protein FWG69_06335 [Oscillospiraceae bacterium]|nr:hypothetical protein [Oscillospiraceae bacterium]
MAINNEVKNEIVKALETLGHNVNAFALQIFSLEKDRHFVFSNGQRFGVWDSVKKTFVD